MRRLGLAATACYILLVVAANWLTRHYGFWTVAPGLTATAGTYAAGAVFVFRNLIQETWGRWLVWAAIIAGSLLSWWLASAVLAFASGVTFLASEGLDWTVYTPLRRYGWRRAATAGNLAGGVLDTFMFLALAGFPVLAAAPGQLVGKAYATAIYLAAGTGVQHALSRRPVHADAA